LIASVTFNLTDMAGSLQFVGSASAASELPPPLERLFTGQR